MKWLAAINLTTDSDGVPKWLSWVRACQRDPVDDDFVALTVARTADYFTASQATREQTAERLRVALADWLEQAGTYGAFSQLQVLDARSIAVALSSEAQRADSVLVVGRAARREDRRLVRLGAVTRRVLRHLTTPTVVVPPDWTVEHAGRGPIVVAVDATAPSLAAWRFARQLATKVHREVVLAHALPGVEELGVVYLASTDPIALRRRQTEAARHTLLEFLSDHELSALPRHVHSGPTVQTIAKIAAELDAAMIVCGSRRLSVGERLLSASIGSELAAIAPVPVAIAPPDLAGTAV
ncbi:MAG: universal stress protein [Deltaproteobacteria bacterium]|nr:universal stress protein [Deltaproteobacteria bacterium]